MSRIHDLAIVGAGVITVLKQWLQDILPKVFGSAGNFEVIIFGVMMVIVLQRARDGLWPLIAGLVPVREAQKTIDPAAAPLPRKPQPPRLVVFSTTSRRGFMICL